MTRSPLHDESFPVLAPVELEALPSDAVSHSLAVLSTVYHYNHWIFVSIREHLGPTILEIGSGIGNITQFLLNADRVACLEPFAPYCQYLATRFAKHLNVSCHPYAIEQCPNDDIPSETFDSVICLNVIEHIEDDVEVLKRMKQVLRPGGRAVVLAPAMPCIYGEMDRAMGHFRRYTLRSMRKAFMDAGLKPQQGRYMNMLGTLGWWWRGSVRKKAQIPQSATLFFDRLVPVLSAVEYLIPTLFGQSVVLVGQA